MKPRTLILSLFSVLVVSVVAGSFYMLSFSLAADVDRGDVDRSLAVLYERAPYMRPWTDSVRRSGLLRDTTIVMPSGERHHALYMRCDSARGKTAVVVHGYKDDCYKFLFLGRMYHQHFGYNILDGKSTRFVAAEPASCPKLTRGVFQYDFGDLSGLTPLLPMSTLGHALPPATIHAGGLR